MQNQFVGVLINRRKRYPAALRDGLNRNMIVRVEADYRPPGISRAEATRALARTRLMVETIRQSIGGT